MIYKGGEPENHCGSRVRYFHCGKWHEGTLLEPVNYQFVVTKEFPPAILSAVPDKRKSEDDVRMAAYRIAYGDYHGEDFKLLSEFWNAKKTNAPYCAEVETVEITNAYDISEEEAKIEIERVKEKYLRNDIITQDQ